MPLKNKFNRVLIWCRIWNFNRNQSDLSKKKLETMKKNWLHWAKEGNKMKVVHTFDRKEATPKLKAAASLSGYAINNRLNYLTSTKLIRKDVKRNILSNAENKAFENYFFILLFLKIKRDLSWNFLSIFLGIKNYLFPTQKSTKNLWAFLGYRKRRTCGPSS